MPPKFKFSKEQIISVALYLTRQNGISAVTARAIGAELCSSPKVIFGLFNDMGEVRECVVDSAKSIYKSYIELGLKEKLPFKGVGTAYIRFAREEPKLFQLLFMRESDTVVCLDNVLNVIEGSYESILNSVSAGYGFSREVSLVIYRHLWIYTHGIASLIATKVCTFSDEEISRMLTEMFKGILYEYKSEGKK